MISPEQWNDDFKARIARAVGTEISYDINTIIKELCEDVQNDALGLPAVVRKKFGIVSRAEAESEAKQPIG